MDFQLDREINRFGTHCAKWDAAHVDEDVVCSGCADMDFASAPAIAKAIQAQVDHGIFGYTLMEDCDWNAVINWREKYHNHTLKREWLLFSPGVIPSLHAALRAVSEPGDRILVEPPVYPPFFGTVTGEGRTVAECPMQLINGHWERDWELMEKHFRDGVKVFMMCSPHNPTGRVYTREEQERLAALCIKYDITVVCDEIHADLILPGHTHTPLAVLPGMEERTITALSGSKTFNMAGLQISTVACVREDWRKTMAANLYGCAMGGPNVMAKVAQTAAYTEGRPWLEAVLAYVDDNARRMVAALNECGLPATMPEGTYLIWVDGTRLGKTGNELVDYLVEKARVHVQSGEPFGAPNWFRLNMAAPAGYVDRMIEGFKKV